MNIQDHTGRALVEVVRSKHLEFKIAQDVLNLYCGNDLEEYKRRDKLETEAWANLKNAKALLKFHIYATYGINLWDLKTLSE